MLLNKEWLPINGGDYPRLESYQLMFFLSICYLFGGEQSSG